MTLCKRIPTTMHFCINTQVSILLITVLSGVNHLSFFISGIFTNSLSIISNKISRLSSTVRSFLKLEHTRNPSQLKTLLTRRKRFIATFHLMTRRLRGMDMPLLFRRSRAIWRRSELKIKMSEVTRNHKWTLRRRDCYPCYGVFLHYIMHFHMHLNSGFHTRLL
jgi:hypothetical protein